MFILVLRNFGHEKGGKYLQMLYSNAVHKTNGLLEESDKWYCLDYIYILFR